MSQQPSKQLTELARSGHAESLNALLDYFMNGIGTTARASIKYGLIELILEGSVSTPDKHKSEKYLKAFFRYLQVPTIQTVKAFAKNYHSQRLAWFSILLLDFPKTRSASTNNDSGSFYRYTDAIAGCKLSHSTNLLIADKLQPSIPIAFENLPNNLQRNIQSAGLRPGQTRSYQEAKQIYEMMPENVRRGGIDAVQDYKQQHDWSHKRAHADGGPSHPSNGDWEYYKSNRARGSRQMTEAEANDIGKAKAEINFQEGSKIVVSQAAKAGAIAFGMEVAFSGLENFLAVQNGEKTVERALEDTLANSSRAAVVAATVVGSVSALTLVFPPTGAVLSAAIPVLQIVGVTSSINRLVVILSNSNKVQGIDQLENLMLSYGIDKLELDFRALEVENELYNLKLAMQSKT